MKPMSEEKIHLEIEMDKTRNCEYQNQKNGKNTHPPKRKFNRLE